MPTIFAIDFFYFFSQIHKVLIFSLSLLLQLGQFIGFALSWVMLQHINVMVVDYFEFIIWSLFAF